MIYSHYPNYLRYQTKVGISGFISFLLHTEQIF